MADEKDYFRILLRFNKKKPDQVKLFKAINKRVRRLKDKGVNTNKALEIKSILCKVLFEEQ